MNGDSAKNRKGFGDYQTPQDFATRICKYLKNSFHINPNIVIEPTCGLGNFLESAYNVFNSELYVGIEINPEYSHMASERFIDKRVKIFNEDLFLADFSDLTIKLKENDSVLIVGNPPWVNNSALSSLNNGNCPVKSNFKGMIGLDAITGSANFDICEYMLLRLINSFRDTNTTIALLCKTIVARNCFSELIRTHVPFSVARVLTFDSKKIFGVSADSCLFCLQLSKASTELTVCEIYNFENPNDLISEFGFRNNHFYSNLGNTSIALDGACCFEWRQGIKHDCSKIMELHEENSQLFNGNGDAVNIESQFVYPLIKSSQIKTHLISDTIKRVIVTQYKVGNDTSFIKYVAPLTWMYLNENLTAFRARKSSIYKNAPDFSMFGVGDYSFSNYKVGISGFYKKPIFSLLHGEKPIMMDDTCYFIGFSNYNDAYVAMLLLNSPIVQNFLGSIAFVDSKRPYTKKVLERIDFGNILLKINFNFLCEIELSLGLSHFVTAEMLAQFTKLIESKSDHAMLKLAL